LNTIKSIFDYYLAFTGNTNNLFDNVKIDSIKMRTIKSYILIPNNLVYYKTNICFK